MLNWPNVELPNYVPFVENRWGASLGSAAASTARTPRTKSFVVRTEDV
jgi:hypothetical protein